MLYFSVPLSNTYLVHLYFADDADLLNLPIKLPDAVEMLYDRVIRVKENDDIAYVHFLELLYIFNLMFCIVFIFDVSCCVLTTIFIYSQKEDNVQK
jgi:hypothetical protein